MSDYGTTDDRLAIRELIEALAHAVMQRDEAAFIETFAEDAVWVVPSLTIEVKGRDAILRAHRDVMALIKFMGIFVAPAPVTIDGDHARALAYQQEFFFRKDGTTAAVIGQYSDEYVKRNGRWYFQSRVHTVLNAVPGIGWVGET